MHQGVTWNDWSNNKNATLGRGWGGGHEHFTNWAGCWIRQQKRRRISAEPRATLSIKKKQKKQITRKDTFALPLISTVTHPVCFISPLTRVALSKGVRALCKGVRLLPSLWGIVCRSSNASHGSLIKRNVKKKKWGSGGGRGSKWEEETERFLLTLMHLSVGRVHLPQRLKGGGPTGTGGARGTN